MASNTNLSLRVLTQTSAVIIQHILPKPNSIIVLLFICIFIGLTRVNACIINKNISLRKPFVFFRFWHKQHKLVDVIISYNFQYTIKLRHNVVHVSLQYTTKLRHNDVYVFYRMDMTKKTTSFDI
jgi:hypothetical protein